MPYDYHIIRDQNLLVIVGSETVTSKDIYDLVLAFQRDPAWKPSMNMLVDWRAVTELQIEIEEVKHLARDALDAEHMTLGTPLGIKAAIVITDFEHETVPLLYAGYLRKSGLETRVFHGLIPALVWLGVDPAAFPQA